MSRLDLTVKNWRWWVTLPVMVPLLAIVLIAAVLERPVEWVIWGAHRVLDWVRGERRARG